MVGVGNQLSTFDVKSKSAKIQKSHYGRARGELEPTFDAESKTAETPKIPLQWGGGGWEPTFNA